jgi:exopolysaccharide biosynthesis WecB/TagA/CpsF family protein
MPRTSFMGLGFDTLRTRDAARVIAALARKQYPFAYVATPNVDHLVRLERKPELRALYARAWLNLCDSRILELFAKLSGVRLTAAPGADVVETLFRDHIHPEETVVIVGGTSDLVRALRADFALADIRWFDAPTGLREDVRARAACADFVANNPAPWIFLAVGSPQQEMIALEILERGDAVGVAVCCGASLEFLSGAIERAPKWMRHARLEWLHRLGSEPTRLWRRYLVHGPRILSVWMRWLAEGRKTANPVRAPAG